MKHKTRTMPAQPTQQPRSCWSCGYDISTLSTTVCPECGKNLDDGPPKFQTRHSWAIFNSLVASLVTGGTAFVRFVSRAADGVLTRAEWTDFGVLIAIAATPFAYALMMIFRPPSVRSEAGTTAISATILALSIIAMTTWLMLH